MGLDPRIQAARSWRKSVRELLVCCDMRTSWEHTAHTGDSVWNYAYELKQQLEHPIFRDQ